MGQKSTGKNIIWSFVEKFSSQGIQFVLSLIIARRLMPSDYGLIAMLSVFFAIAQTFVDSGFSNALIQKQNRSSLDCTTVFWFNIAVAILFYFTIVFFAPFISVFYNEPILKSIICWSGLNLIINSFSTVQRALLVINLNFKRQAIITIIGVVVSGLIGVVLAYQDFGVWALVAQSLSYNILTCILLWITSKWFPIFKFSIQSFNQLFFFGSKILGSRLLHTIYINLYSLIIGKFYQASELGLYNKSNSIVSNIITSPVDIIQRVAYPIECQLQSDNERLSEKFKLFLRMTCFIVFPICVLFFALADSIIDILLTKKWQDIVPYIRIIGMSYLLYPLMTMNTELLNAKHRSDYSLKAEIWKKILSLVILFVTLPFGVKVMCFGLFVYQFIDVFIVTRFTKKVIKTVTLWSEIKMILPILFLALSSVVPVPLIRLFTNNSLIILLLGGGASVCLYFCLSLLFKRNEFSILSVFFNSLKNGNSNLSRS